MTDILMRASSGVSAGTRVHRCTRAGWLPHSPKVTTMTGMLRRWRVLWDRRRKPYSKEYSTMYSSCGHTAREGGREAQQQGSQTVAKKKQHLWTPSPHITTFLKT